MANLIQRLVGDLTPAEIEAGEDKIRIHAFIGALDEQARGKVTGAEVIGAFALTASQTTQATTLVGLANAAPDRALFVRTFKNLMYMGESDIHSRYRDIVFINTRLEEEVTDQGGTLP